MQMKHYNIHGWLIKNIINGSALLYSNKSTKYYCFSFVTFKWAVIEITFRASVGQIRKEVFELPAFNLTKQEYKKIMNFKKEELDSLQKANTGFITYAIYNE